MPEGAISSSLQMGRIDVSVISALLVVIFLLLSTAYAEPGSVDPYYTNLIKLPSSTYGLSKKYGEVPYDRVTGDLRTKAMYQCLNKGMRIKKQSKDAFVGPCPQAKQCALFVNYKYKILFVRNRKAASTSLLTAFNKNGKNARCTGTHSTPWCLQYFGTKSLMQSQSNLTEYTNAQMKYKAVWKDFLVFGVSRNPWSRAASAYNYLRVMGDREVKNVCPTVGFLEYCKNPNALAQLGIRRKGCMPWKFATYHLEPFGYCAMTGNGSLAFDFVLRYEKLEEDLSALIKVMNSRKDPSLPDVKLELDWVKGSSKTKEVLKTLAKQKVAVNATDLSSRYDAMFSKCGPKCVESVARWYKMDLKLFGWTIPSGLPATSAKQNREKRARDTLSLRQN